MLLFNLLAVLAFQTGPYTERISLHSAETEGNGPSTAPAFCADGRYVAFVSTADNLVRNDLNGLADVFLRARHADRTIRISVSSSGAEADAASGAPALSADGHFIAFESEATNLVPGDSNGVADVFVHDSVARTTVRVSVGALGAQASGPSRQPSISGEGRWITFASDADDLVPGDGNGATDVFLHDLWTGVTERVSVTTLGAEANGPSRAARISGDGRFVVFESDATDLVPLDANGVTDVFLHDRMTGDTLRVSAGAAEANGPSFDPDVSTDGYTVVFTSAATNLAAGDTNGADDVFLHDRRGGSTERFSVSSTGAQASGRSGNATMIPDGTILVFDSDAPDLIAGDTNGATDVFMHHRASGLTERISLRDGGGQGDAASFAPSCAVDARVVAFASDARFLVPGDGNQTTDIFVRNNGLGSAGTDTTKILAVAPIIHVGDRVTCSILVIAPGNPWWLIGSFSNAGGNFGGNHFEVGPPVTVLASGYADGRGNGVWISPPLPPAFAGRTFFAQVGVRTDIGIVRESNLIERIVR